VVLAAPGRGDDLPVRVSARATSDELPVIVFSHGFGRSLDSYAPLVEFWAARGHVARGFRQGD
jgi:predicted dienelactone hydrolase